MWCWAPGDVSVLSFEQSRNCIESFVNDECNLLPNDTMPRQRPWRALSTSVYAVFNHHRSLMMHNLRPNRARLSIIAI